MFYLEFVKINFTKLVDFCNYFVLVLCHRNRKSYENAKTVNLFAWANHEIGSQ